MSVLVSLQRERRTIVSRRWRPKWLNTADAFEVVGLAEDREAITCRQDGVSSGNEDVIASGDRGDEETPGQISPTEVFAQDPRVGVDRQLRSPGPCPKSAQPLCASGQLLTIGAYDVRDG